MKKILSILVFIFCFVLLLANVNASEKLEKIKEETQKHIYNVEYYGVNGNSAWEIIEVINKQVEGKYDNYNASVYNCDEKTKKCTVHLFDEDTSDNLEFTIDFRKVGTILNEESVWVLGKGETKQINFKYLNEEGVEEPVRAVDYYYDEDKLSIENNTLKVIDDGYSQFQITYKAGGKEHYYSIIVLCNAESLIEAALAEGSFEYIVKGDSSSGYDYGLRDAIINKTFKTEWMSFSTMRDASTHSGNVWNFDFDIEIGDKKFTFKKDNFTIIPRGFSMVNVSTYQEVNLNKDETFQLEFNLYDDSISFTSENTAIATVTNDGLITGKSSGITFVCAKTNLNYETCIPVQVKPDDAFKATIASALDKVPDTIKANLLSNLTIEDNYDLVYDYIGEEVNKYIDDESITAEGRGQDIHNMKFCLSYGKYYRHDDYYYSAWFNTDDLGEICKTITFTYADEDGRVNAADIAKAKELAKIYENKEFPSYLDKSIDDYMKANNGSDEGYFDIFVKNANMDQYLSGNEGYSFKLDTRAGNSDFGSIENLGYGMIKKNGIVIAIANNVKIYQTMDLQVVAGASKAAIENQLVTKLKSLISDPNVNVSVKELTSDREGKLLYKVIISEGNSSNPLLAKAGSSESDNRVVIKTYVDTTEGATAGELTTANISVSNVNGNKATIVISNYLSNQKYTLEKSTNNKKWSKVKVMSGKSIEVSLTYGQKTYFRVKTELGKTKKYSNKVDVKVYPDAVTNLKVESAGSKNIKVTYDKASYTGYEVQRSTKPDSGFKKVAYVTKSKTTTYNNKKLKNATTYYYRVRAYKKVGSKKVTGPWSNVVSATTGPAAPSKLTLKAVDYQTISVSIKPSKTAISYEVQRSTKKKSGFATIGTTNETIYDDTVNTNKTYYYRVKACNENNVCSGWSKVYSKKTTLGKASISTSNVEAGETPKVTLTLNAVAGADGYEIQRSTKAKKGFKTVSSVTDTNFEDTAVVVGKTYYYKVRAYRTVNGKKVASAWTKVIKISVK